MARKKKKKVKLPPLGPEIDRFYKRKAGPHQDKRRKRKYRENPSEGWET